jgi:hypothetical protein
MEYQYRQPVLLKYVDEDLEPQDLGMSGIVLHGPFRQFEKLGILNETFYFFDYFKDEEWCSIERINSHGETIRSYNIRTECIKAHPSYEKIGDEWFTKLKNY